MPRAYSGLAGFYYSRDRIDEAIATLEEGIEKADDKLDLIYTLARFHAAQGNEEKADALIEQATTAEPDKAAPLPDPVGVPGPQGRSRGSARGGPEGRRGGARQRGRPAARGRGRDRDRRQGEAGGADRRGAPARRGAARSRNRNTAGALLIKAKVDLFEKKLDDADRRAALRDQLASRLGSGPLRARHGPGDEGRRDGRAKRAGARARDRRVAASGAASAGSGSRGPPRERVRGRGGAPLPARAARRRAAPDPRRPEPDPPGQGRRGRTRARADTRGGPQRRGPLRLRADSTWAKATTRRRASTCMRALESAAHQPRHPEQPVPAGSAKRAASRRSIARIDAAIEADPENARLHLLAGQHRPGASGAAKTRRPASRRRSIWTPMTSRPTSTWRVTTRRRAGCRRPSTPTRPRWPSRRRPRSSTTCSACCTSSAARRRRRSRTTRRRSACAPNLGEAKNNLAYLFADSGKNLDRALDLAQEAKALLPDSPNAADTLGWVLYKRGVPAAAISYLKEAEAGLEPGSPSLGVVRYHLALAYESNGDSEEAVETLERALADLDAQLDEVRKRGGAAEEPSWAAEARSLLDRLQSSCSRPPRLPEPRGAGALGTRRRRPAVRRVRRQLPGSFGRRLAGAVALGRPSGAGPRLRGSVRGAEASKSHCASRISPARSIRLGCRCARAGPQGSGGLLREARPRALSGAGAECRWRDAMRTLKLLVCSAALLALALVPTAQASDEIAAAEAAAPPAGSTEAPAEEASASRGAGPRRRREATAADAEAARTVVAGEEAEAETAEPSEMFGGGAARDSGRRAPAAPEASAPSEPSAADEIAPAPAPAPAPVLGADRVRLRGSSRANSRRGARRHAVGHLGRLPRHALGVAVHLDRQPRHREPAPHPSRRSHLDHRIGDARGEPLRSGVDARRPPGGPGRVPRGRAVARRPARGCRGGARGAADPPRQPARVGRAHLRRGARRRRRASSAGFRAR